MVSQDSTCTAAREASSAAAASYSREQRAAACGVRHNVQTGIKWSGNQITISCQAEHQKIPPLPKHPLLKKHFFIYRNPMYPVATAINMNGDTLDMPNMQPTEHPRTSPPGFWVSEHMPRRPSCVCLPGCSSREQMRLALSKLEKLDEVAFTLGVAD